jgi:hypothetical protein
VRNSKKERKTGKKETSASVVAQERQEITLKHPSSRLFL